MVKKKFIFPKKSKKPFKYSLGSLFFPKKKNKDTVMLNGKEVKFTQIPTRNITVQKVNQK